MVTGLRIVLVAEESAGEKTLRALVGSPHRVVAVLTSPPGPSATPSAIWRRAAEAGVPVTPAAEVRRPALAARLRREGVDILLNVHSIHLLHREVLAAPRLGCFNLHPGPLPRYAGLNAPSWAIYRGERTHGVTLHEMDAGIDTGRIVLQETFPIDETDTGLSLSLKCIQAGLPLIDRLLQIAASRPEAIPFVPQDVSRREYFGSEVPQQGMVAWDRPAKQVHDFVRAASFAPFPSPWGCPETRLGDRRVGILRTARTGIRCAAVPGTVAPADEEAIRVACADEWLQVRSVQLEAKAVPATALQASVTGPIVLGP